MGINGMWDTSMQEGQTWELEIIADDVDDGIPIFSVFDFWEGDSRD